VPGQLVLSPLSIRLPCIRNPVAWSVSSRIRFCRSLPISKVEPQTSATTNVSFRLRLRPSFSKAMAGPFLLV
jgi:hypothetical protein